MVTLAVGFILITIPTLVSAQINCRQQCNCCVDKICTDGAYCDRGCIDGIWGARCYNICPSNCTVCDRNRDSVTWIHHCKKCIDGHYIDSVTRDCSLRCPEQCKTCLSLTDCQECNPPYYNLGTVRDCSLHCPINCKECNPPGNCTVCRAGFFNVTSDCTSPCPVNCPSCTSLHGCTTCKHGFYNGREEDSASSVEFNDCRFACRQSCMACNSYNNCSSCETGTYGITCLNKCPSGCLNNICQKETGLCDDCYGNFKGDRCDECKASFYTEDCSKRCPSLNCKDISCNRVDGACPECQEGWFGNFCNETCSTGCIDNTCIQTTGVCSQGCRASFTGDKCCIENGQCQTCSSNDECQTCTQGFYGDECDQRCSENCTDGCNKTSGVCVNCKTGKYGTFCELNCSATCDQSCDRGNGQCFFGCIKGLHGHFCNNSCHSNCIDKICRQENGHCFQCVDGYEGPTCLQKRKTTNIIGPVVGGIVGFITLTVVMVVGFICLKRIKLRKDTSSRSTFSKETNAQTNQDAVISADHPYVNQCITEHETNGQEKQSVYVCLEERYNTDEDSYDIIEKKNNPDVCYYNVTNSISVDEL